MPNRKRASKNGTPVAKKKIRSSKKNIPVSEDAVSRRTRSSAKKELDKPKKLITSKDYCKDEQDQAVAANSGTKSGQNKNVVGVEQIADDPVAMETEENGSSHPDESQIAPQRSTQNGGLQSAKRKRNKPSRLSIDQIADNLTQKQTANTDMGNGDEADEKHRAPQQHSSHLPSIGETPNGDEGTQTSDAGNPAAVDAGLYAKKSLLQYESINISRSI